MRRDEKLLGWFWLIFQYTLLTGLLAYWLAPLGGVRMNLIYHGICACAGVLIFRSFLLQGLRTFLRRWRMAVLTAAAGLGIYFLSSVALRAAIFALYPAFSNANDSTILSFFRTDPVLTLITTVLLAPISEELLFRGLLFQTGRRLGRAAAYALSIAAFAFIHVGAYVGSYPAVGLLLCFLQYIPAGAVLAWSVEHTGSIATSMLIHMAVNLTSVLTVFQTT